MTSKAANTTKGWRTGRIAEANRPGRFNAIPAQITENAIADATIAPTPPKYRTSCPTDGVSQKIKPSIVGIFELIKLINDDDGLRRLELPNVL